jgi:hypothetical protein
MQVPTGKYVKIKDIPFKAMLDDSHFVDEQAGKVSKLVSPSLRLNLSLQLLQFYIQGSYDLRTNPCGPKDSSECMLTIDTRTGNLLSSIYTPNFTGMSHLLFLFFSFSSHPFHCP